MANKRFHLVTFKLFNINILRLLSTGMLVIRFKKGEKSKAVILTVGTYSEGNLFVVYEIRRQVLPTAPSPTTTHLMVCIVALSFL